MNKKIALAIGALLMASAVLLGAFGAHYLRTRLDGYSLSVFDKANFYHFVQALGILCIAGLEEKCVKRVVIILCAATLIFSGSLYLLAITGVKELGAITPIGGAGLIIGWVYFGVAVLRK